MGPVLVIGVGAAAAVGVGPSLAATGTDGEEPVILSVGKIFGVVVGSVAVAGKGGEGPTRGAAGGDIGSGTGPMTASSCELTGVGGINTRGGQGDGGAISISSSTAAGGDWDGAIVGANRVVPVAGAR